MPSNDEEKQLSRQQRRALEREIRKLKPDRSRPDAHAHKLVAHVATKMAAAVYEEACRRSNDFYAANPDPQAYVDATWRQFLPQARHTLAEMLNRPGNDDLKDVIADGLIADNLLQRGRHVH